MDKNAIKKYAVWAREELIEKVTAKAIENEIVEGQTMVENLESINGEVLSDIRKKQRRALIQKIKQEGFNQVMEEVAYTWFNRFVAIRFMEVNGFLPSHVRVFTNDEGVFRPQIMEEALHLEIEGLDIEKVYELKNASNDEELFRYLLIVQCNALSNVLPKMFQRIEDYTELLLPDYLLRDGSVIHRMIEEIPEENWTDQVQIIGWLYQYYNSQLKSDVAGSKITKETIAPATQLFTPDWIVRYMVDNSLGRLWEDYKYNDSIQSELEFYLTNDSQMIDSNTEFNLEGIKCIDPCMGSGHVLCYLFDLLVKLYEKKGYTKQDAVKNIIGKNIWGIDVDDRAAQLAYFSVMMKARQYDRRFLMYGIEPHIISIQESNSFPTELLNHISNNSDTLRKLLNDYRDAKEYGSLIKPSVSDLDSLYIEYNKVVNEGSLWSIMAEQNLLPLLDQTRILSQKYDVVVTNPPYLGRRKSMNDKLIAFLDEQYPEGKMDLFSAFISRNCDFLKQGGYAGFMTPYVWLYLNSYIQLREKIMQTIEIQSLVQLEENAFSDAAVSICTFVMRKKDEVNTREYRGTYLNLEKFAGEDEQPVKVKLAASDSNVDYRYERKMDYFDNIPDKRFVFWISEYTKGLFKHENFEKTVEVKQGITTSDNERFLRLWFEVNPSKIGMGLTQEEAKISDKKWFPYSKGGENRRWYGNNEYVINYAHDGEEIKAFHEILNKTKPGGRLKNREFYFKKSITWSDICGKNFAARSNDVGFLFDVKGSSAFVNEHLYYYILAFMNTELVVRFCNMLNPSVTTQVGDIKQIPLIVDESKINEIEFLAKECISIAKNEWDSYEVSWNFEKMPLADGSFNKIEDAYKAWEDLCNRRFEILQKNETKLNKIFFEIYGFEVDVDYSVKNENITLRKADLKEDIEAFLSYAIGCMFGRYKCESAEGFIVDNDNIIPITDDEYYSDDILARVIDFISRIYGEEYLEENLRFIADALGGKGSAREVIRNYYINDFYAKHISTYQKRPIYWLFDSGKKNGFKCLIYMHRYQPDTIARIRTDYVHEQQARYRTAIEEITNRIESASGSDKVKLTKKINTLKAQNDEIHTYEEKIHHLADQMISINLDDGVKVNYAKFKDVLAKIK